MDGDDDEPEVARDRPLASAGAAGLIVDVDTSAKARGDADEEVKPQQAKPRSAPVQKTKPTRRLQPGDLVCGQCGEGNAPTRKFCSRCGNELLAAEVAKAPWWRRLMFWQRWRRRKVMEAGKRPGQPGVGQRPGRKLMKAYRKVRAMLAVVLMVVGVVYLFVPPARGYLNNVFASPFSTVKERVNKVINPKFLPARPAQTVASSEIPDHGAPLIIDQFSNTYWAATWDQQQFPRITLTFDRPVTIAKMIVTSGAGDDFATNHRPSVLHLVYSNNQSDDVRPEDGAKPQTFELANAKDITTIEIGITEIYRAQDALNVAIAELEFFVKE